VKLILISYKDNQILYKPIINLTINQIAVDWTPVIVNLTANTIVNFIPNFGALQLQDEINKQGNWSPNYSDPNQNDPNSNITIPQNDQNKKFDINNSKDVKSDKRLLNLLKLSKI
jgi:hypothetical protein